MGTLVQARVPGVSGWGPCWEVSSTREQSVRMMMGKVKTGSELRLGMASL